jgi:hypothetical protein
MNRASARRSPEKRRHIHGCALIVASIIFLLLSQGFACAGDPVSSIASSSGISKAAAGKCSKKIKSIQEFGKNTDPQKKKITQISQDEVNSFLALELSSKFGPSLKNLQMFFGEASLRVAADIDFDALGAQSSKLPEKLLAAMISGIHTLTAIGTLHAEDGEAYFKLEEARFDAQTLPNFLVEEIITAVGRRQKPSFDPLQPSQMPYHAKKVDLHRGTVIIYQ